MIGQLYLDIVTAQSQVQIRFYWVGGGGGLVFKQDVCLGMYTENTNTFSICFIACKILKGMMVHMQALYTFYP